MEEKRLSAQSNQLTSAREICEKFQTPFDTTAKVMQKMNNHRILSSSKGIKGGYSLDRNLQDITYLNIVEIIEGPISDDFCIGPKGRCDCYQTCNIIAPVDLLNQKINEFLSKLTLQDLLFEKNFLDIQKNSINGQNIQDINDNHTAKGYTSP